VLDAFPGLYPCVAASPTHSHGGHCLKLKSNGDGSLRGPRKNAVPAFLLAVALLPMLGVPGVGGALLLSPPPS
jgi:hypothetical protein